jgi:L-lactate dehydrogenase
MTNVAGVPVDEYASKYGNGDWHTERERIAREVKESAYHIINYKGATYYGIGMALTRIVGAILQDQQSVLTISTFLEGEYGVKDVCLGVPCVLGQNGVVSIVEASLTRDEQKALEKSATTLRDALNSLQA